MLNILAGKLKGMKLKVPSQGTRPTTVMLRRKMFDRYIDWSETTFVDLCAGSGAMGLEAISRGAKELIAIEKNTKAYLCLKDNFAVASSRLRDNEKIEHYKGDFLKVLRSRLSLMHSGEVYYFDPPYEMHDLYDQLADFITHNLTQCNKPIWWIESDIKKGYTIEDITKRFPLSVIKDYSQGDKFIICMTGAADEES